MNRRSFLTSETEQPCGCVVVTDNSPVIINGVDMSKGVASICAIRRCAQHQAEWNDGINRFSDSLDQNIAARIYAEFKNATS